MPDGYEEDRHRRLLLNKEEIKELTGSLQEKGFALVPLRAYLKRGFIKLELRTWARKEKIGQKGCYQKKGPSTGDEEREVGLSNKFCHS